MIALREYILRKELIRSNSIESLAGESPLHEARGSWDHEGVQGDPLLTKCLLGLGYPPQKGCPRFPWA